MIDFNSDKIIMVCYPQWAGGKFLANSIGLSNKAVFQDQMLAYAQLDGNFNLADKVQYIHTELDARSHDLKLGCHQLFGVENYLLENPDVSQYVDRFNPVIERLTDLDDTYFFLIIHNTAYLNDCLKIWPNAKLIIYHNCKRFLDHRANSSTREILPIDEKFPNYKQCIFNWDCDWYFDPETTLLKIQELYTILGLTDFNREEIQRYYDKWFKQIGITDK